MPSFRDKIDYSQRLAFDIETIPLAPGEYPPELDELVAKKLERALKSNPEANRAAETKKVMATDPLLGRIVCIGMYYPNSDTKVTLTDDSEKVILEKFWKAITVFPGIFVGFNTVRFDCPFIVKRSIIHGVKPTNPSFLQFNRYDPYPPHFDVMLALSGREGFVSLKHACAALGIPSSKDGGVVASNVEDAYRAGRIKEIADYCLRDVIATYKLYEKLEDYVVKN
jgi:predicted PolB exonuclease-like 3'-5' exonuclease